MQNIRTDLAVEAHELSRREAKNATEIDGVISVSYTHLDVYKRQA